MVQRMLGSFYDENDVEARFGLKVLEAQYSIIKPKNEILFKIPEPLSDQESLLRNYRYYHTYLKNRRISENTANAYDIGYDNLNDQITFPLRDIYKNCLGIGRRNIKVKRYEYPKGLIKPIYGVYELPKFVNYLWVVEGPFNLWSLYEWGKTGIALLGTGTEHQYKELLKIKCSGYVLALDSDEAGRKGIYKLSNFLENNNRKNIYVALLPDGKDINDLTHEEFTDLEVVTLNRWLALYNVNQVLSSNEDVNINSQN